MDENESPNRLILLAPTAEDDLSFLYASNLRDWGQRQALAYQALIKETIQDLADDLYKGRPVEGFPALYQHSVRWKNARHSHLIIFRLSESMLEVARVLHSSMDIPTRLTELE
jgi:plasmid stabilization system protein ParE